MRDQTDDRLEKINDCCLWLMVIVIVLLALAVCIGIVAFAWYLNT